MRYLNKYGKWILTFVIAMAVVSSSLAAAGIFGSTKVVATGDEGCTPGFWKNHTELWLENVPGDLVGSVFVEANAYPYGSNTLIEALKFKGGGGVNGAARILLRAGVAAWLNSVHDDIWFATSDGDVLDKVNDALASNDRATMIFWADYIDSNWNNLYCPIPLDD